MFKQFTATALLIGTALLAPCQTMAASPIGNVGGAAVNDGKSSFEARFGYTEDDNGGSNNDRFQTRQLIDYGVNDWYAARLYISQDNREADGFEHANIALENRFQIIEKHDYGWDGGVRFAYVHNDGDKKPDGVNMRLVAGVPIAPNWKWTHNTFFKHDVGENAKSGVGIEIRNRINYRFDTNVAPLSSLSIGMDLYNDFGKMNNQSGYDNQDHQLGPVFKLGLGDGLYSQASYRAGLSNKAADHSFILFLGKVF